MVLSNTRLGCLVHVFRLIVSRGAHCLRVILALIRRFLSFLKRTKCSPTLTSREKGISKHASSGNVCGSSIPQTTSTDALSSSTSGYIDSNDIGVPIVTVTPAPDPSMPSTPVPQSPKLDAQQHLSPTSGSTKKAQKATAPFAPEDVQRYQRRARINKKDTKPVVVDPYMLDFKRLDNHGWERCMHPEGALYFYQEENGRRTMTDSNMDDERVGQLIRYFARKLWGRAASNNITNRSDVELVLSVSRTEGRDAGYYYFVSHEDHLVFWLDEFTPDIIFYNVRGVEAIDHIKLAVETQYWCVLCEDLAHCELYPNHIVVRESVVEELRGMLLHAVSEGILTDGSLTPLPVSELQQLLGLLDTPIAIERESRYLMCVIGRLMRLFMRLKFINFFGQAGARLNADQSLYGRIGEDGNTTFSSVIKIVDPMMFGAPSVHVKQLRRIWVDRTINILRWRTFIDMLSNEWNGFTIYSTVMLAVDVSFLGIPDMTGRDTPQTIAQVAIFCSTLSAVGSLLASVLLNNQIRAQGLQTAERAASYMLKMASSSTGMDALGVMFSIPFALIMWGMIFFLCGLSLIIFGSGDVASRIVVIPFWIVVAMLASWPAWYAGERLLLWTRKGERRKKKATRGSDKTLGSTLVPMNEV